MKTEEFELNMCQDGVKLLCSEEYSLYTDSKEILASDYVLKTIFTLHLVSLVMSHQELSCGALKSRAAKSKSSHLKMSLNPYLQPSERTKAHKRENEAS